MVIASKEGTAVSTGDTVDGQPPPGFGVVGVVAIGRPSQLPAPVLAPDGQMRVPLEAKKYLTSESFVWPLLWVPEATEAGQVCEITTTRVGVQMQVDGSEVPLIWGRSTTSFLISDLEIIDIGNGGASRSTRLFDMVASPLGAEFTLLHSQALAPKFLGTAWNYETTIQDFLLEDSGAGVSLRSTVTPGASMYLRGARFVQTPGADPMVKPMIAVTGSVTTFACYSGDHRPNDGDSVLAIPEGSTGDYDVIGNSLSPPTATAAAFLALAVADTLTEMAAVDIAISAVEDSTTAPGVDSAIVVGAYTGLRVGQSILLAGLGAPYDGLKTITRLDPTERKIEFASVFAGTATGSIKITRFTTSAANDISEGEPVEVASVSYNLTEDALFVGDDTFDLPVAFVLDDGAGSADVARRDEKSLGINLKTNGDAKDSKSIGGCVSMGNTAITTLAAQPAWTDLVFAGGGLCVATSDIERWEVADATTGELRLLDRIFDGGGCVKISAVSSGSPQRFQFRIVRNGAPMADGIVATDGLSGITDNMSLEAPIVRGEAGDLFRVQVQNIDGLSSLVVEEFLFTTKKT